MRKALYAFRDKLAGEIVGGVHVFPHDAPAVRFFGDIAGDPQSQVAKHLGDYELVRLAFIDPTGQVECSGMVRREHDEQLVMDPVLVISGNAWKAAQLAAAEAEREREGVR